MQLDRSASAGQGIKTGTPPFWRVLTQVTLIKQNNNGDSAHTTPAGLVYSECGLRPVSCYFDVCVKI